jgi:hypothetical protein
MSQKIHYPIFSKPNSESATLFQALATALTDTYAAVGSEIDCQGHTTGYLHLYWTKGDESSVEVKAEFSLLSAGTLAQEVIGISTDTNGQDTLKVRDYTFSTASDNIVIPFRLTPGRYCKIYIKATGGTPTGTYGAGFLACRE